MVKGRFLVEFNGEVELVQVARRGGGGDSLMGKKERELASRGEVLYEKDEGR